MLMVCLGGDCLVASRSSFQYTRIVKIAFILRASTAIRPYECTLEQVAGHPDLIVLNKMGGLIVAKFAQHDF
jgi:hypothetical protein